MNLFNFFCKKSLIVDSPLEIQYFESEYDLIAAGYEKISKGHIPVSALTANHAREILKNLRSDYIVSNFKQRICSVIKEKPYLKEQLDLNSVAYFLPTTQKSKSGLENSSFYIPFHLFVKRK